MTKEYTVSATDAKPGTEGGGHTSLAFPLVNITNSLDNNNKLYQELGLQEDHLLFPQKAGFRSSLEEVGIGLEGTGLEGIGGIESIEDIGLADTGLVGIVPDQDKGLVAGYNSPFAGLADNMPVDLAAPGCLPDSYLTGHLVDNLHILHATANRQNNERNQVKKE
ncbi:hypothetical protein TrVFT333_001521 [Trichoderma virens FT-333]|nr:hypothetical protein TrVFT333_001521 [Trichoderma virens FT-333]